MTALDSAAAPARPVHDGGPHRADRRQGDRSGAMRAGSAASAPEIRDPLPGEGRPRADGKLLAVGDRRLTLRGVTYGTFAAGADGTRFRDPDTGRGATSARWRQHGVNAVRMYTVPPRRRARRRPRGGLWVLVGLPWEQHVTFLDRRAPPPRRSGARARRLAGVRRASRGARLRRRQRDPGRRSCAGTAARRVERFLERSVRAARAADPGALVTYVSYPSTEYLRCPPPTSSPSTSTSRTSGSSRPTWRGCRTSPATGRSLIAELGLDSRRHGHAMRRRGRWRAQLGASFAARLRRRLRVRLDRRVASRRRRGARLGLRARPTAIAAPKPALAAVRDAFAAAPLRPSRRAPRRLGRHLHAQTGRRRSQNASRASRRCATPTFEAIVVDDGSTDASAAIAARATARG